LDAAFINQDLIQPFLLLAFIISQLNEPSTRERTKRERENQNYSSFFNYSIFYIYSIFSKNLEKSLKYEFQITSRIEENWQILPISDMFSNSKGRNQTFLTLLSCT
jgi:hypothetical protein